MKSKENRGLSDAGNESYTSLQPSAQRFTSAVALAMQPLNLPQRTEFVAHFAPLVMEATGWAEEFLDTVLSAALELLGQSELVDHAGLVTEADEPAVFGALRNVARTLTAVSGSRQ